MRFWLALLLGFLAAAMFGGGTLFLEGEWQVILQVAGIVLALYVGFRYTDGAILPSLALLLD